MKVTIESLNSGRLLACTLQDEGQASDAIKPWLMKNLYSCSLTLDNFNAKTLEFLPFAPRVTKLELYWANELQSLSGLQQLPDLEQIDVWAGLKLRDISSLRYASMLRNLYIGYCPELEHLDGVGSIAKLKSIGLDSLGYLVKLDEIRECQQLEKVTITRVPELVHLPRLWTPNKVRRLQLDDLCRLKTLDGIECLTNLKVLSIRNCGSLKDVSQIDNCCQLRGLRLINAPKVKTIGSILHNGNIVSRIVMSTLACRRALHNVKSSARCIQYRPKGSLFMQILWNIYSLLTARR